MIRAQVYSRETGALEVVFRDGTEYEIFAEHECWVPTLKRWAAQGISVYWETDEDGVPELRYVRMEDAEFPRAIKDYIERQFNSWHVEVCAPCKTQTP